MQIGYTNPWLQPVIQFGYDSNGKPVPVNGSGEDGKVSQGGLFVPTASANGTELANRPTSTSGASFYVDANASFSWFIAPTGSTPSTPPINAINVTAAGQTDIPVSKGDGIFLSIVSGNVLTRWIQR